MRIYLAATPRDLVATELAAAPAFAVTEALAAELPGEDTESLEYAAYLAAADAALNLLRDRPGELPRRLVIAADVADSSTQGVIIAADAAASGIQPAADAVEPDAADVVASVTGAAAVVSNSAHPAAVRLPMSSLEWSAVASIHIDEPAAAPDLIDAIGTLASRPSQTETTDALIERDLLWYDPTERQGLIEDLAAGIA